MSSLDDKFLPLAKKLIDRLGRSITFFVETAPIIDVAESSVFAGVVTEFVVKGTPPGSEGLKFLGFEVTRYPYADNLPEGSTFFYVPSYQLPFTIVKGQKFTVGSDLYQVESVDKVWSGEQVVLYGVLGKS